MTKLKKEQKKRNIILLPVLITGITVAVVYVLFAVYYNYHFFVNTNINGVNVSNKTVSQVEAGIKEEIKSYQLTIQERNNKKETIQGKNIKLHAVFDNQIKELLKSQNGFAWPFVSFHAKDLKLKTMIEYDSALLKTQLNQLQCFSKDREVAPVDAHVSEYGDKGFEVVKEDNGAKVIISKLLQATEKSLNSLEPVLNLEMEQCYEEPKIKSDNPNLIQAAKEMNRIAGSKITYHFGDKTELVDAERISKWLHMDQNFKATLDPAGVKEFVDYIGKSYNSFGRVRTFKTSYDKVIQVKGGDYGWWLNRGKETKELTALLLKGSVQERKPAYFQTARQYGPDDIGDTYVEVNLTAQHLFFYKDGKLILDSDFVSGNVSRNFGTPVGTYPLQYKERDATLVGEDYSTPVKYWMPFNGNVGLHDAYWRSEFGNNIYMTRGSHGCINMPPANAKKVFENISRGVPVVVYTLPGTESKVIKDKDKENAKNTADTNKKAQNKVDTQSKNSNDGTKSN